MFLIRQCQKNIVRFNHRLCKQDKTIVLVDRIQPVVEYFVKIPQCAHVFVQAKIWVKFNHWLNCLSFSNFMRCTETLWIIQPVVEYVLRNTRPNKCITKTLPPLGGTANPEQTTHGLIVNCTVFSKTAEFRRKLGIFVCGYIGCVNVGAK